MRAVIMAGGVMLASGCVSYDLDQRCRDLAAKHGYDLGTSAPTDGEIIVDASVWTSIWAASGDRPEMRCVTRGGRIRSLTAGEHVLFERPIEDAERHARPNVWRTPGY